MFGTHPSKEKHPIIDFIDSFIARYLVNTCQNTLACLPMTSFTLQWGVYVWQVLLCLSCLIGKFYYTFLLFNRVNLYLLSQVMEEVRGARQSEVIFTQKYRINVGDDHKPVIAQAADLYTFHRVGVDHTFSSRHTPVADDNMTPPPSGKCKSSLRGGHQIYCKPSGKCKLLQSFRQIFVGFRLETLLDWEKHWSGIFRNSAHSNEKNSIYSLNEWMQKICGTFKFMIVRWQIS